MSTVVVLVKTVYHNEACILAVPELVGLSLSFYSTSNPYAYGGMRNEDSLTSAGYREDTNH